MIHELVFKLGRTPKLPPEAVQLTPVTLFVGPNNSGKSKILEELNQYCATPHGRGSGLILDHLKFANASPAERDERIKQIRLEPNIGEIIDPGQVIIGKKGSRQRVPLRELEEVFGNPLLNEDRFLLWYISQSTLILNGLNRMSLVTDQAAGDLQNPPTSSLQVLFQDDKGRAEVRRILHEAFGLYFVIDPTNLGRLRIRLANRPPEYDMEERGIHGDAVKFHSSALPIHLASDGVKAFTGIITEIIAGDPAVLLIDEPEAFLHPSLAFTLGKEVSTAALNSKKRLFVSTHSASFVMGCIQSYAPINIVRLTYRSGVGTARVLPSEEILRLMRNPLLRSTGVLNGLFYEFVVVTESDTDRAFYQEINERLLRFAPEWGIPNCLFLNAQNKQTIRTLVQPLRHLGIPAAGVVDLDVLKEGGSVWTSFLGCGFVPDLEHPSLGMLRSNVKEKFEKMGNDMKRNGGIDILPDSDREAANNLFDRLEQYGLFVVRRGELESWLTSLQVPGHGPNWLIEVFEKMGEDPGSQNYLRPASGDVWAFLGGLKKWFADENRKGIPS